jgi:DNA-binding NarL/FixJ family response regulator
LPKIRNMTSTLRRILVVEDELLMQRLLTNELETLGFDVSCANSVVEAKKQVRRFDPDIALVDIGLRGGLSGLHFGHYLAIQHPDIAQIFLSAVDLPTDKVGEGLGLPEGAGFVSKHSIGDTERLVDVINAVVAGKQASGQIRSPAPGALESLGGKGRRVMELVASGYSNQHIAEELGVTSKTVEYYIDHGYKALGLTKSVGRNARVEATLRYQQLFGAVGDDEVLP